MRENIPKEANPQKLVLDQGRSWGVSMRCWCRESRSFASVFDRLTEWACKLSFRQTLKITAITRTMGRLLFLGQRLQGFGEGKILKILQAPEG